VLSRVEVFERIRRDHRLEPGVSVRELARRHGVHRRTVREALGPALPPQRKKPARTLVLEPAVGWIDAMLTYADLRPTAEDRTRQASAAMLCEVLGLADDVRTTGTAGSDDLR
jgi:lambda repressor-like predicted transcriptional regulator